jgi:hypothetical protein
MTEIKSRFNGSVLFSLETESMKLCVEAAVKSGANLAGANLAGANLCGADLYDANLCGANLCGANLCGANGTKLTLVGDRKFLQIGPLGSRNAYLLAFITDGGVYVRAGCFFDTLASFGKAVRKEHKRNIHAREYAAAIAMIEAHAKLWTLEKAKRASDVRSPTQGEP